VRAADEAALDIVGILGAFRPRMLRLVARKAAGFVDDGFDALSFWPVDTTRGRVELLACEVVPQLSGLQPPVRRR
jgi:hypothetical protein